MQGNIEGSISEPPGFPDELRQAMTKSQDGNGSVETAEEAAQAEVKDAEAVSKLQDKLAAAQKLRVDSEAAANMKRTTIR